MASDFKGIAQLASKMDQFAKALGGDGAKVIAQAMGAEAQKLAAVEGARDLGADRAFSGWKRVGPLDTKVRLLDPGVLVLSPASRGAAAVWTTATRGRNNTNAAGFSGPGLNRKTGVTSRAKSGALRKQKAFTAKTRWSGHTKGKNTALDARAAIEREMPKVVERELSRIVTQIFGD